MNNKSIFLFLFIALKFILQYFAVHPIYDLHRDEYLHLDLGNHLALGYISVPPVTAWMSYTVILLGKSVFWIKFFPALFGAMTIVMVWKITESLGGKLFALCLSALCVTLSALLRVNTLYQPNSLEYLIWTSLFLWVIRYVQTNEIKWLWLTGLTFALGFLNKYNIIFLILGLLPALLVSEHRHLLANRSFYLVLIVTLLLISPNLWWQYQNGFPVIWHMKTLSDTQLIHVNRFSFLKDQFMFFMGGNLVILVSFVSFFVYKPFKQFRFLFWSFLIILSVYFYLRAKSYYAIGLYPVYIAFGAVYLEKVMSRGWAYYLRPVLLLIPVIIIVPVYNVFLPVLTPQKIAENPEWFKKLGFLGWEDGKQHSIPQDFADMQGWQELSALTDQALGSLSDHKNTIIHCDNYGMAGAINFYSNQKQVEALTLNADYINWYPLDKITIENVVLVQESNDDDPERKREAALFESVELIGEIENEFAREKGTRVYLLKGAKQDINDILRQEIHNKKENMRN